MGRVQFQFDAQHNSSDPVPVFLAGLAKMIGHLILLMSVTGVCPEAVNYDHPLIISHNYNISVIFLTASLIW